MVAAVFNLRWRWIVVTANGQFTVFTGDSSGNLTTS
jgi:hypothetical protein